MTACMSLRAMCSPIYLLTHMAKMHVASRLEIH